MRSRAGREGVTMPLADVVHSSAGRTRLRFPELRGTAAPLEAVAARLGRIDGVHALEVRPFTGSILVRHDGPFLDIARRAAAEGLFHVDDSPVSDRSPAAIARPVPAAVAMAFAGLGVMQLFERRVLPPALTLFWYAASLAREALAEGRDAAGEE
jgi:hypothetical protein